ncbi:MAG TPA: NUDIX hydrolase [Desulfitobacteriaceae bacterium]|jgi:ADP-ribose pyrophosphatase|nr:NUDIX hydrolase [Desulfitobacteriaceae bacterium]
MRKKDFTETCLSQEIIFKGKIISVHKDTAALPNGEKSTREYVKHPGAVAVVAIKEDGLLLVRQYRYPLGRDLLEIPAGKLDAGEAPVDCAVRELREETGYRGDMKPLGIYYSTPGFSDEAIHLFWARDLVADPLNPDEDEFLEVEVIPWQKALEMAEKGQFQDAKTTLGILLVNGKLK